MLADVTDAEELLSGKRKEGELSGMWSLARKIPAAIGAGAGLWLLGAVGYASTGPLDSSTLTTLSVLYAGVPCLCNAVAIFAIWPYSIDRLRHLSIQQQVTYEK
jgi:Na+/melibiose symporter-like transporter